MKSANLLFSTLLLFAGIISACKDQPKPERANSNPVIKDTSARDTPEVTVNPYASVDISPMDMSYFPVDYPKIKMANAAVPPPAIRLIYSRPHLQKRALFNGILKYNEPWRLGANEASEISFYKPVTIQNKKIPAGRYIIYGIPHPDKWTIILNRNIDTWGLKQDSTLDVGRFDIPISTNTYTLEYFTMVFEKADGGADLIIAWADIVARLPIKF